MSFWTSGWRTWTLGVDAPSNFSFLVLALLLDDRLERDDLDDLVVDAVDQSSSSNPIRASSMQGCLVQLWKTLGVVLLLRWK